MNVIDRRRNLGPSNAQRLKFDIQDVDERTPSLPYFIRTGTVKDANGSSYIENDVGIVQSSVFGPRPNFTKSFNTQASLRITLKLANFVTLDILDKSLTEKQLTSIVQSFVTSNCANLLLLDNYPKSSIEVFVDLISLSGSSLVSLLASVQNSVNVALMDSGLNLKAVPACGYLNQDDGELLVNCCHGDNYDANGEEILGLYSTFNDYDNFDSKLDECIEDAKKLRVELNNFFLNLV